MSSNLEHQTPEACQKLAETKSNKQSVPQAAIHQDFVRGACLLVAGLKGSIVGSYVCVCASVYPSVHESLRVLKLVVKVTMVVALPPTLDELDHSRRWADRLQTA